MEKFSPIQLFIGNGLNTDKSTIDRNLVQLEAKWSEFVSQQRSKQGPGRRAYIDKVSGQPKAIFSETTYYRSHTFEGDLKQFFSGAGEA